MLLRFGIVRLFLLPPLVAGDVRLDPLEAERKTRPPHVETDAAPSIERAVNPWTGRPITRVLGAGLHGFRVKAGAIDPASGFALGPELIRRDLVKGRMMRVSFRTSLEGDRKADAELAFTRPKARAFANVLGVWQVLLQTPYFGQGADTPTGALTYFRREEKSLELTAGVRPAHDLRVGATGGYLNIGAERGDDPRYDRGGPLFPAVPLALRHSDFITAGGFFEYDSTDIPGGPRAGGDYSFRFTEFGDRSATAASHRRYELRAQHYFPFLNRQRVVAVRAWSVMTQAHRDAPLPFYIQPSLGGPDTLRGYAPYRFYDNNLLLLSAEYRWKISSGADLALFADGGNVFPKISAVGLRHLKSSYGAGIRLNARDNVFARLDVGCSREGCQLWFRFHNIY